MFHFQLFFFSNCPGVGGGGGSHLNEGGPEYIVCLSKTTSLVSFKVSNLIRAQQAEPGPHESAVIHNHRLRCSIQSSHIHLQYTVYHLCDAPHLLNILSLKIWTAVRAFDIQMHAYHVLYILWSKSKMRFFFSFFFLLYIKMQMDYHYQYVFLSAFLQNIASWDLWDHDLFFFTFILNRLGFMNPLKILWGWMSRSIT